ncbi:MAG: LysM peptidoglycan-binding domain-containing protein [Actinomycetota bacterium]
MYRTSVRVTWSFSRSDFQLTQRGRFLLFATVLTTTVAIFLVVITGKGQAKNSPDAMRQDFKYVTVLPGETLWSIAAGLDHRRDRRDVVIDLMEINKLPSAHLIAGQVLAIPQST